MAIRLADAGGLDAVTMRGVAAELGIAPMSLYNYVPTKDHLIQLMIDLAGGEYRYPGPESASRRAAIADLARQGRDITRRHPWLPDTIRRPAVIGPNGLRYLDCFLGLLADRSCPEYPALPGHQIHAVQRHRLTEPLDQAGGLNRVSCCRVISHEAMVTHAAVRTRTAFCQRPADPMRVFLSASRRPYARPASTQRPIPG